MLLDLYISVLTLGVDSLSELPDDDDRLEAMGITVIGDRLKVFTIYDLSIRVECIFSNQIDIQFSSILFNNLFTINIRYYYTIIK